MAEADTVFDSVGENKVGKNWLNHGN
jgi:hypothetical protein